MEAISKVFQVIAGIALANITIYTLLDILMRALKRPFSSTLDVITLSGAIVISYSLSYTTLKGNQIRIEFLYERLSQQAQRKLFFITRSISFCLFVFIFINFIMLGLNYLKKHETSMALKLPLYTITFALSAAILLHALVLLGDLVKTIRKNNNG